ncbi:MAG: glycosyltransferase family 4 protein [Aquincola tertiaricarbonis]|uniref:glycosyltransferase family 4 protein n=1 Tax=Aquincola TaxID=391952 RepID=UPI000AF952CB|nr:MULTISPECIES: glycosyltransferase family 1 protein [Aquincola]MCR5868609.1 glycosyltransferase family 1 protein [Aquincola sp. J276]
MVQHRRLRIGLISEHASPLAHAGSVDAGGQNVYVSQVARALAAMGHHVDVLTRRDDAALPAVVDVRPGMRVVHIDAGPPEFVPKEDLLQHMPAFTRASRHLMQRSVGYDLLHANFFMSGWVGLALRHIFEVPLVMTFHALGLVRREHQGSADTFPAARIDIERRIVQGADRLIAECPQDRDDLVRLYGAQPETISTVPCGVDLSMFGPRDRAQARRRLGLREDEFVVLQLGRLVPRKGIDNVIRAVGLMDRALKPRLLVVGGESVEPDERRTPEIARLRAVARDAGVEDLVTFTGRRDVAELPDYYAAADVFVTTPAYEPFGITPLEAMACGTPVVGSAVGGIQYSVVDGVTGYLVPPKHPAALAERLSWLCANPALRGALGRAGMARVRSQFTWDRVASQLAEVYQEVCEADAAVLQRPHQALHRGAGLPAAATLPKPAAQALVLAAAPRGLGA